MKNNYFKIIVFFLVLTCGYSLFQASEDPSVDELSYISKMKRDLIVLQEYAYRQISSVLNIDLGAARMLARLKADIRKQYPCEHNFEGLQVRQGTDLCQSERNFIENRMPKISQALQQHFDVDIPLKIAFCTSGGGNRAMLTTIVLNDPRLQNYDKNMVTILHCPFIKNDRFSEDFNPILSIVNGYCNTFNFKYTKEQAEQVVGLARYNISSLKSEIKEVFQALEKQKSAELPVSADKTVLIF